MEDESHTYPAGDMVDSDKISVARLEDSAMSEPDYAALIGAVIDWDAPSVRAEDAYRELRECKKMLRKMTKRAECAEHEVMVLRNALGDQP
jgi:hypothetical protein